MLDPFERDINYLRISVTDRCNLNCSYCRDGESSDLGQLSHEQVLRYEDIRDIAREAAALGIKRVRLTGGEPLIKRGIEILIRYLKEIEGLREVAMTTNGTLLADKAQVIKDAGLDRLNISLDTLDPDRYRELTGGGEIPSVLEGIEAALAAGFIDTKLNMVVMPGFNEDEVDLMRAMCHDKGLNLQLIRRFSLTEPKDPEAARGFHRPPPCMDCNRLRLLADGTLKPCLHADIEIPVDLADIKGSILKAVSMKPEHGLACENRKMNSIGG